MTHFKMGKSCGILFYFLSWFNKGELYYVKCFKINTFAPYHYILVKLLSKTVLLLNLPARYNFIFPILILWVAGER